MTLRSPRQDDQAARASLTVVVGAVDHVGVALPQVSQQEAEHGAVAGQRGQVDGAAAIFVRQTGVHARPQEQLRHLRLAGDHGQVQRRLRAQVETAAAVSDTAPTSTASTRTSAAATFQVR